MAQLFQLPKQVPLSGGAILAGAKGYFYLTGTTTPTDTYTTSALSVANANPVVADAAGVFPPIWLDPLVNYKLTLNTAADVLVYTADPITEVYTQAQIGAILYPRTAAESAAGVTPTNYFREPGDVRRYGAVAGGSASTNMTAFQNALDSNSAIYVPDGTFTVDATLNWNDGNVIHFQSRNAILKANLTSAILKGKDTATTRRYRLQIYSGTIDNTARTNAGGIAVDLFAATMCKLYGTEISNVETAVRSSASGVLGSFYNEFHGVDILTVDIGYEFGTFGNENKVFGGRVNDCEIGARTNDNSGHVFDALAVEAFTTYAFDVAPSAATQYIRILAPRMENTPTVGTGIRLSANAQSTFITDPQAVGLTTNISDSGVDTMVFATDKASPSVRARRIKLAQNALDSSVWAQLLAGGSADIHARNSTDTGWADLRGADLHADRWVRVGGAASGAANKVTFGNATQTTVGAAGGASALPATPSGYLRLFVGTTEFVIPYYQA